MTQNKTASTSWADALIDGLLPIVNVAAYILNVSAVCSFLLNGCLPNLIAKLLHLLKREHNSLVPGDSPSQMKQGDDSFIGPH